jgi:hypothetical protein
MEIVRSMTEFTVPLTGTVTVTQAGSHAATGWLCAGDFKEIRRLIPEVRLGVRTTAARQSLAVTQARTGDRSG